MKSKNTYSLPVEIKDEVIAVSDVRAHYGVTKNALDFPLKKNIPILAAQSGEIIYVPARRKTHFKPGKILKEALHKPLDK